MKQKMVVSLSIPFLVLHLATMTAIYIMVFTGIVQKFVPGRKNSSGFHRLFLSEESVWVFCTSLSQRENAAIMMKRYTITKAFIYG